MKLKEDWLREEKGEDGVWRGRRRREGRLKGREEEGWGVSKGEI